MNLVTINDANDVVGHHHIKTKKGRIFLDSLITNHPLAVIDFLEESYDALISLVLEREKKYSDCIISNPNDLDFAIDEAYGIYKYDSELDQEIEKLEDIIFIKEEERGDPGDGTEFLTDQEMETLSKIEQCELFDTRFNEKLRKQDVELVELKGQLEDKIKFKESLTPIRLDFIPTSSELLEGISTDDEVYF